MLPISSLCRPPRLHESIATRRYGRIYHNGGDGFLSRAMLNRPDSKTAASRPNCAALQLAVADRCRGAQARGRSMQTEKSSAGAHTRRRIGAATGRQRVYMVMHCFIVSGWMGSERFDDLSQSKGVFVWWPMERRRLDQEERGGGQRSPKPPQPHRNTCEGGCSKGAKHRGRWGCACVLRLAAVPHALVHHQRQGRESRGGEGGKASTEMSSPPSKRMARDSASVIQKAAAEAASSKSKALAVCVGGTMR